ncbi:tRNA (adenosine(37)-N6)-threonylcarbamoyltransferase complex ATPase subunit type 1 TsaE [Roseomonas elaeocarpi]|uniref:tRNA threonylcarbamoyladenosine biosynthesis protein TsaE n=1 Tax=Roseomonas elaeocarpi TaxID=907779 RepID=A0ABV6JRN7_9PROT
MTSPLRIALPDLAATERLAARLAALARAGDAILLSGPLGAGKSAFARAFLRAAAADPALEVPSPTFTLVQGYEMPAGAPFPAAHHFDLYRLGSPDEVEELGWDEAREGVVIVEWPERLGPMAPAAALRLRLSPAESPGDEEARVALLEGWAGRLDGVVG